MNTLHLTLPPTYETVKYTQDGGHTFHTLEKVDEVTHDDLNHAAYHTPVETLVGMWLTKYGNEWVKDDDVDTDEFFKHARIRLTALGRLESHQIAGNGRVHRLPV
jgi:hypothetical protein